MQRLPITYRDFYDIPRAFVVERDGEFFFFDCAFDESEDEYPSEYVVYLLPADVSDTVAESSWDRLAALGSRVGSIPTAEVQSDSSKRESIDSGVFGRLRI
jgi:hypothetical protein